MIRAFYSKTMIDKAHAIVAEAARFPVLERDAYCQNRCGLTYDYLRRIGLHFLKPSDRTLMNLGYELYAKDVATGEFHQLDLDVKCDWNPQNPRMNPVSMPVSVTERSEESTLSE